MNIDQALIALCRKHGLTRIEVCGIVSDWHEAGHYFAAIAFWRSDDKEHNCKSASGQPTATEAIAHAIQQVNEARACMVDVPAMELECGE